MLGFRIPPLWEQQVFSSVQRMGVCIQIFTTFPSNQLYVPPCRGNFRGEAFRSDVVWTRAKLPMALERLDWSPPNVEELIWLFCCSGLKMGPGPPHIAYIHILKDDVAPGEPAIDTAPWLKKANITCDSCFHALCPREITSLEGSSHSSFKAQIKYHILWEAFPPHLPFHSHLLICVSVVAPLWVISLLVYSSYFF